MEKSLAAALDFIKRNFDKKILLKDIAASVGLSSYHFQRSFKKEFGESPTSCLNRIRLEKAAHLLLIQPQTSISNIAYDNGFQSLSQFSRAFQKKYACSPSQFREKHLLEGSSIEISNPIPLQVNIVHFEGICIRYKLTSIFNHNLFAEFQEVRSLVAFENKLQLGARSIGVYNHVPFADENNYLNYYAGIEISSNGEGSNIYHIPAGKYACFQTNLGYDQLHDLLISFKQQWLDQSPFIIKHILAFEIFEQANPSSSSLKRHLFIPLEKKQ